MNREQYHAAYTALENDAKAGRRSWESVCAQIAMLSIELGVLEAYDGPMRRVERLEAALHTGRTVVAQGGTRAELDAWRKQAEIALYGEEK